jgi:hypothetical protein
MGIIRSVLIVFFSIVLLLSLIITSLLFTIALTLDFQNIQPAINNLTHTLLEEEYDLRQNIDSNLVQARELCENNSGYTFQFQEQDIEIPCEIIIKNTSEIIEFTIQNFTKEIYYQEYNCDFWNCFQETGKPFFLVSKKAQDYWYSKFYISLIATLAIIAILYILFSSTSNFSIFIGGILVLSSLVFIKLDYAIEKILTSIVSGTQGMLSKSFDIILNSVTILFSQTYQAYLTALLIGIGLIILGILIKFFGLGMKLSAWLEKCKSSKESNKK